jgi:hypothetical protein
MTLSLLKTLSAYQLKTHTVSIQITSQSFTINGLKLQSFVIELQPVNLIFIAIGYVYIYLYKIVI